ncbi:hypothetical protein [Streptomyces sp. NPDC005953]|uniref:hypothetical protein n=1 Tax=Streptomyces sp. NPDC005953 TaxID=3156719 RepID=UPI0033E2F845
MGTPRRTSTGFALTLTLLIVTASGCASPPRTNGGPTATPTPRNSSAVAICITLISYWAKESLKGSKWAGLDWEQKGLSNEQFEIHEELLSAARAEERHQGREAALELIDVRASQECSTRQGATGNSENWRPPIPQG